MVKSSLTKPDLNKVRPLLSGHLRDLPKCPLIIILIEGVRLIEVVKIAQCLLTINIQWLLCTMIKLLKLLLLKKLSRVQVHCLSLPTLICLYMQKD